MIKKGYRKDHGKGSERRKSERQKSKKSVESLKVDRKFEKDQNVENEEVDRNVESLIYLTFNVLFDEVIFDVLKILSTF